MKQVSTYLDEILKKRHQRLNFHKKFEDKEEVQPKKADNLPKDSDKNNEQSGKKNKSVEISNLSECESMLKTCEKIDNAIQQNPNASNETLLNLTDPDCRVMKSDSTTKECFNTQIITNNQVIVASRCRI